MSHILEAAIRAYQQQHLAEAGRELRSFAEEKTLDSAVARAGLAERFNGKRWLRYDHQRRLPRHVLEVARTALLAAPLAASTSFHDLFGVVDATIRQIPGVGELMVYDTALRIGQKLDLEPERVYLHSGTRVGARRLGLGRRAKWILREELPPQLQALPPWQVEDILCIFKDWFTESTSRRTSSCSRRRAIPYGRRC